MDKTRLQITEPQFLFLVTKEKEKTGILKQDN